MKIWRNKGYNLIVVARDKDVTLQLLDHYGFDYTVLSKARRGLAGLSLELLEHEGRLLKLIREKRPDVILEVAGTFIVHAAALTRTSALVFYDTEHARLSNAITYPFATKIITPNSYKDDLGRKHVRYNGYQELAYLHPNYFTPDPSVLDELGVAEGEKYSLVRLVSWDASHDRGHRGLPADFRQALVHRLEQYGRIFISAEGELPAEFEPYRLQLPPQRMHDVLAFAQLYLGEGATMASEAALLGTPAIYINTLSLGYLEEQERKYRLVYSSVNPDTILSTIDKLLLETDTKLESHQRREQLLADKIDSTQWIVDFVDNYL
jgi:predicted glycosyltransferase